MDPFRKLTPPPRRYAAVSDIGRLELSDTYHRAVKDPNAWMRPLLTARRLPMSQTSRLTTPNTNGVEGMSVWDRQAQEEMQLATELQADEMLAKREAMERRRRSSSLYSGSMWKRKADSPTPGKRMSAKDRIAMAMRKIAAAAGEPARSAGRSDSSSRTDAADTLMIDGKMYMKDARGVWRDVVSGEPCSE